MPRLTNLLALAAVAGIPASYALPAAGDAAAAPQLWTLSSDSSFNGKRLDAVNGSIFIGLRAPDPDLPAVIIFNGTAAIGPYPGQTYFVDNVAALRYTEHGETPDGLSTNFLSNNMTGSQDGRGFLTQTLVPYGWTACPSPAGASPNGIAQVFINNTRLVGNGTGAGCTPFLIRTVPVPVPAS